MKPWIKQRLLEKMEEKRKHENINPLRRLNNELRRDTDKAKEKAINKKCDEIAKLNRLENMT